MHASFCVSVLTRYEGEGKSYVRRTILPAHSRKDAEALADLINQSYNRQAIVVLRFSHSNHGSNVYLTLDHAYEIVNTIRTI